MTKPREWWINTFSNVVFEETPGLVLQMDPEIIHVIEKSAYDSLIDEIKEARKLEDQLLQIIYDLGGEGYLVPERFKDVGNKIASLQAKLDIAVEALEKISNMECSYGEGGCDSQDKRRVAWDILDKIKEPLSGQSEDSKSSKDGSTPSGSANESECPETKKYRETGI